MLGITSDIFLSSSNKICKDLSPDLLYAWRLGYVDFGSRLALPAKPFTPELSLSIKYKIN